jgi:hypothetical protein
MTLFHHLCTVLLLLLGQLGQPHYEHAGMRLVRPGTILSNLPVSTRLSFDPHHTTSDFIANVFSMHSTNNHSGTVPSQLTMRTLNVVYTVLKIEKYWKTTRREAVNCKCSKKHLRTGHLCSRKETVSLGTTFVERLLKGGVAVEEHSHE